MKCQFILVHIHEVVSDQKGSLFTDMLDCRKSCEPSMSTWARDLEISVAHSISPLKGRAKVMRRGENRLEEEKRGRELLLLKHASRPPKGEKCKRPSAEETAISC